MSFLNVSDVDTVNISMPLVARLGNGSTPFRAAKSFSALDVHRWVLVGLAQGLK